MSQLNVNTIKNRVGNSGPTFDGNTTVSGILTATSFVGNGSGITNLTLTGDGDLANLDVTGVSTFTGNINASSADFSGDVTINGSLTYQDVTNIDSVGMVTARKGIQVLADGLTVVGVTTFNDDVKLLDSDKLTFGTGSDLEIYHSSTSSHIVDVGTGNFIIGSNGGSLKITKGDDTENMAVFTPDGAVDLYYNNVKKFETTASGATITGVSGVNPGDNPYLQFTGATPLFAFRSSDSGGALSLDRNWSSTWHEVLNISRSTGDVKIGTTNDVTFGSRRALTVANGATGGVLSLYNSTTATNNPRISSNPGGSEINDIGIHAASTNGSIIAYTNNDTEALRIDPSGHLLLGTTIEGNGSADDLTIAPSGGTGGITIRSATDGYGNFFYSDGTSGTSEYTGYFAYEHSTDNWYVGTNGAERFRIGSSGEIGLSGTNYGTSGQVLTSNGSGSGATWQDAGGGAWNLITTLNASNDTQVDLTGTSSTYDKYCIIARNVYSSSASGTYVYAQVINNGTVVSSTDYRTAARIMNSNSSTITGLNETSTNNFLVGRGGDATNEFTDFYIYFNSTHSGASNLHLFRGYSVGYATYTWNMDFATAVPLSVVNISGIRFTFDSGGIYGTFQLYGIS